MFEISQLRCFVAVGDELHFGRAAERLHMTQPPLSRQIRLLEHHVGTPLFERTNRVVRFTAAGKAFFSENAQVGHQLSPDRGSPGDVAAFCAALSG